MSAVTRFALISAALVSPCLFAVEPLKPAGLLTGRVTDSAGVPQMGAVVTLYNRYERLVARLLTNERGGFTFDGVLPDLYSVRVNLASFVPAIKRNIAVQPGMRSFLAINLTSVLSSVELVYTAPSQTSVLSEDWKWVLRSAGATRPVLRILPGVDISDPAATHRNNPVFSGTRGMFRLSAGDAGDLGYAGSLADLGTAFALATSVYGSNKVSLSGNFGYASHSGNPTAGFSTSFSRDFGEIGKPEVNVTMRQVFLPVRVGAALASGQMDNLPAMQSLAVTLVDRRQLTDNLELEYGSSLESVSFLNRLSYASPFARLRWGSEEDGALEVAFSSGTPPTELLRSSDVSEAELQHNLVTLSLFPRVSLRNGQAAVQRTENFELGYRRKVGSRTFSAGAYKESTANAAIGALAQPGAITSPDLLPDLATDTSVFNAGRFKRMGYSASVTQNLGGDLSATISYGYSGAISPGGAAIISTDANELRGMLRRTWRHSMTARVNGTAPKTGTRYAASYQVTDYSVLHPVHLSLAQRSTLEPGLNLYVRQPIPRIGTVIPGRLEATAEVRNILAQGYLPIATPGGHRLLLVQSPRAVRGGVSLIF